ncbi:MAG: Uma2 family endonuclease [Pirellula sp.]
MSNANPRIPSQDGEPAWEAAYLLPLQGRWSEEDFLKFHSTQMAELTNGRLEILPMPNLKHQRLLKMMLRLLEAAAPPQSLVLFAPLPTKLFPGTIREPDLLYISQDNLPPPDAEYPSKIDLAMEIVSDGTEARKRDYEDKRLDYAKAGVAEYWIVDPLDQAVTVLALAGKQYIEHGRFVSGETASGKLLSNLMVDVAALMQA